MVKVRLLTNTIQLLDISDEEYFGNGYTDYVSNSRLKLINPEEDGSPAKYKAGFSGGSYSDSLLFGSAVHQMILQPKDFHIAEGVNRPTAKAGFMADELYPHFKRNGKVSNEEVIAASDKIGYYKGKMDEKRIQELLSKCADYFDQRKRYEALDPMTTPIYLDYNSKIKLQNCLQSVGENKRIQKLLHPSGLFNDSVSFNETTLIMDVEVTVDDKTKVLKLKAKLDNFTYDGDNLVLNDLKTTGHYLSGFSESFDKYHYYRQMGMYSWMLVNYIKNKYGSDPLSFTANMLLVSTVPDYYSGVFPVRSADIKRGYQEFIKLLGMVAYCEIYGYNRESDLSGII